MTPLRISLVLAAIAGCGHFEMYGTVVQKRGETEANVCMAPGWMKVGEKLEVSRHSCYIPPGPDTCTKEVVAEGEVVRLLNDHYGVARFTNANFKPGDTVELKR